MAIRKVGSLEKVVAVIFTSLVAPVMVNIAVTDLKSDDAAPDAPVVSHARPAPRPASRPNPIIAPLAAFSSAASSSAPRATAAEAVTQVIIKGVGRSPDAALQQALRNALQFAVAAQVDADTWTRNGPALLDAVLRENRGVLRGWKDLGGAKEWKLRGIQYHKEVAVEVDRVALLDRLRAARAAVLAPIPFAQAAAPPPGEGWRRVVAPSVTQTP